MRLRAVIMLWHRRLRKPQRPPFEAIYDSYWYEQTDPNILYLHPVSARSTRCASPALEWKNGHFKFQALTGFFRLSGDHAEFSAMLSLAWTTGRHGLCALDIYDAADRLCGTVHVPVSSAASFGSGKHELIRLLRTHLSSDGTRYPSVAERDGIVNPHPPGE